MQDRFGLKQSVCAAHSDCFLQKKAEFVSMACMREFGLQGHLEFATAVLLWPGLEEYLHLSQCLSEELLVLFVNTTEPVIMNWFQN